MFRRLRQYPTIQFDLESCLPCCTNLVARIFHLPATSTSLVSSANGSPASSKNSSLSMKKWYRNAGYCQRTDKATAMYPSNSCLWHLTRPMELSEPIVIIRATSASESKEP